MKNIHNQEVGVISPNADSSENATVLLKLFDIKEGSVVQLQSEHYSPVTPYPQGGRFPLIIDELKQVIAEYFLTMPPRPVVDNYRGLASVLIELNEWMDEKPILPISFLEALDQIIFPLHLSSDATWRVKSTINFIRLLKAPSCDDSGFTARRVTLLHLLTDNLTNGSGYEETDDELLNRFYYREWGEQPLYGGGRPFHNVSENYELVSPTTNEDGSIDATLKLKEEYIFPTGQREKERYFHIVNNDDIEQSLKERPNSRVGLAVEQFANYGPLGISHSGLLVSNANVPVLEIRSGGLVNKGVREKRYANRQEVTDFPRALLELVGADIRTRPDLQELVKSFLPGETFETPKDPEVSWDEKDGIIPKK